LNRFKTGDELEMKLTESKNKTFLRFGLHYDGLYKSAALINFTQKNVKKKKKVGRKEREKEITLFSRENARNPSQEETKMKKAREFYRFPSKKRERTMKDTTIILPIYKIDEEEEKMLLIAVKSVENFKENVKLLIVTPEKISTKLETLINDFKNILEIEVLINNSKNTGFAYQVNLGIENCNTEWFSILEIDDEYKEGWYSTFNEYKNYYKDVDIFLPIIEDINPNGTFGGFTNESIWAYGFTEKQGYLDKERLLEFQNFQTSGSLFKTNIIKNNGLFKDNIKLTFSYEFLLRMANNDAIIMGIPKIGYKHVNFRENSLFWRYRNDEEIKLSNDEVKFWIDTAKNEYFFKNKREVNYDK
jgi:hypothetical protein